MELQQFVSESLKQIISAVVEAQDFAKGKGASINPTVNALQDRSWDSRTKTLVQEVEFDVAVTAAEGTETKGGIGVMTAFLAIGSHGKADRSNIAVTRLRFTVPVAFPSTNADDN